MNIILGSIGIDGAKPHVPYTLGLDIGIASVGAALLGEDHILALHVRTFNISEDEKGKSLNSIRREKRSTRKRLRRKKHRLLRLRRLFHRMGLIDTTSPDAVITKKSPWDLRFEGLDRLLAPDEWAGVLYHLLKHRGIHSTRKSKSEIQDNKDADLGKMLSGVKNNQALLADPDKQYRTAGEMAVKDDHFRLAKKNKHGDYSHTFARADMENELRLLFEKQRKMHNAFATPEFERQVYDLLMQRRPALSEESMKRMLGKCTFEKDEYRAPKFSYSAERFRWLTCLNNLRISGQGETRKLTSDERNELLELPFILSALEYKQVRQRLKIPPDWKFIGLKYPNDSDLKKKLKKDETEKNPEEKVLFEAKGFHTLKKLYGKSGLISEWERDKYNSERLDLLIYAMTIFKDDDKATQWLLNKEIERPIIDAVLNDSFTGFIRLSIKALQNILPFMESGFRYDEAVKMAGYEHHSQLPIGVKHKYIPRLSRDVVANPVVARALNQARKLVNAIIREYGPPKAIHIELARQISLPYDERKDIQDNQNAYRDAKQKDIKEFARQFGASPKGKDLQKWRLYREQDGKCAYSLKPLHLEKLFTPSYAEIDHALPYSRSFINGMNNKVLVLKKENSDKGNSTPFEYLDGVNESPRWLAFVSVVNSNPKYSEAKRRMLLRKDFSKGVSEQFKDRNLQDTRYIARYFKNLLESTLQLEEKNCVVVSGALTGFLRTAWKLLKVREEGDKHHALDAAVVAACSRGMIKRVSDYSRRKELQHVRQTFIDHETGNMVDFDALDKFENEFPQPWPQFSDELKARLSDNPSEMLQCLKHYSLEQAQCVYPIRVSRGAKRSGIGEIHDATIRSTKFIDQDLSSKRTPLKKLDLENLPKIAGYNDPRNQPMIDALRKRLEEFKGKGKTAFKEPFYKPAGQGKQPSLMRSVKLTMTQKSGLPVRKGIAKNGDMVRVDIFKKGKKHYIVPIYPADAYAGELPCKAIVANKPEEQWDVIDDTYTFLFSLRSNDWVKVVTKDKVVEGYYAWTERSGQIAIRAHDQFREGKADRIGIKVAMLVSKYHVDMLGRLYLVEQEIRQRIVVN